MTQEGQRIEFTEPGPYLFPELSESPLVHVLETGDVAVAQFDSLYVPIAMAAAGQAVDALANLTLESSLAEDEEYIGLDFDGLGVLETPLLSAVNKAMQVDDLVFLEVLFGEAKALIPLAIQTAGLLGQLLAQAPDAVENA